MNKKRKTILISSAMAVIIIALATFFLIIKPSQSEISPLGFTTLAEDMDYSEEKGISTFEEAKELCNLKCLESSKVGANFELGIMVCYCDANHSYILDTKTLRELTLAEVEERAFMR